MVLMGKNEVLMYKAISIDEFPSQYQGGPRIGASRGLRTASLGLFQCWGNLARRFEDLIDCGLQRFEFGLVVVALVVDEKRRRAAYSGVESVFHIAIDRFVVFAAGDGAVEAVDVETGFLGAQIDGFF